MAFERSTALVALLALAVAVPACGTAGEAPDAVTVNGVEITDRQHEMLAIVDDYITAWGDTDGDAAASFMTPDGYVQYPEDEKMFFVSDRTLQWRVTNGPYGTLRAHAPAIVYDDRVVLMGTIDAQGVDWLSVIRFTEDDPLRIVSETIFPNYR